MEHKFLPTRGNFCCLFIFESSLDPAQAQQKVSLEQDPNYLTLKVFQEGFWKKLLIY